MSIDEYNGGTMVGMVGKNCVGIATDRRLGKQMLTVSNHFQKVFKMQDNIILGLSGLATDVLTLYMFINPAMLKWRIESISTI
jgi:20S proteasome subunit beta 3